MALLERVEQDLQRALKQRDEVALRTLRLLKAALIAAVIAKRPAALTEIDAIKTLRTELKRRDEAVAEFRKGNRQDLVDKESAEAAVLRTYLPAGPDAAAVRQAVVAAVAKLGASGPQDFGKVMGAAMRELGANVDGNTVSRAVKEVLFRNEARSKE